MTRMKEVDFIKNVLNEWVKQFDGIHVRYAYEQKSEFHIIEVEPETLRKYDKNYKKAERALWKNFMMQFPDSDLLISEPCRTNDMSNVLFDSDENKSTIRIVCNYYENEDTCVNSYTSSSKNSKTDWKQTIYTDTSIENQFSYNMRICHMQNWDDHSPLAAA